MIRCTKFSMACGCCIKPLWKFAGAFGLGDRVHPGVITILRRSTIILGIFSFGCWETLEKRSLHSCGGHCNNMPPPQRCWSPSWPASWPGPQGRAPGALCTNEATTSTFTAASSLWPQAEAPILLVLLYNTVFVVDPIITCWIRLPKFFKCILKGSTDH